MFLSERRAHQALPPDILASAVLRPPKEAKPVNDES